VNKDEQINEMYWILKSVEWVPLVKNKYCPMCYCSEDDGHNPDCRLLKALGIIDDATGLDQ